MADDNLLMKKQQEYIQQRKEELQLSEDYFTQYAQMDQLLNREAKEQITRENVQQRIQAEREAGLAQKKIPEQELPQEVLDKIQAEHAEIHDGEQMSNKEMKKAKKEYKRKIEHTKKAQKILDNFKSFYSGMTDTVVKTALDITGKNKLDDNQRKNVNSAVLASVFTGGTMIDTADTILNLSVKAETATNVQAERKAYEIEKMFKIILDYDIGKLKYKNSADFLKNASEKLAIGQLATEMDSHLTSYRELVKLGKLKKPLNPKLLNEIEARVNLIMTSVTRTDMKLQIMASEKYALTDRDALDEYDDDGLAALMANAHARSENTSLSEEARRQAKRDYDYYKGVRTLRALDANTAMNARFKRGDDPEKLLAAHRKEVNEKYQVPADYEEKLDEQDVEEETIHSYEEDGIQWFRSSLTHRLDKHASSVNADRAKALHNNADSREYAHRTYAKHWDILRSNEKLRRQEIRKYYGILHRGKKIPDELLNKIEQEFAKKFEMAKKVDPSVIDATQSEHESRLKKFKEKNISKNDSDRGADAVFYVLRDLDEEKQVEKYKAFSELYNKYGKTDAADHLNPEEKQKTAERLKDANKELIDYVTKFDLKKLEFTDISDIASDFAEINHYMQIMSELQALPNALYRLGIVDDAGFVDIQSRIDLVIGYSWVFQNSVSAGSSVLSALVDTKDLMSVNDAEDISYTPKDQIPKGEAGELSRDKENFENLIPVYETNIELSQYNSAVQGVHTMGGASYYMPGGSMEAALAEARKTAKDKLEKMKKA